MKTLLPATLAALSLSLGGCYLQIEVPEGGHVVSASGAYHCGPAETCRLPVVDIHFNEGFKAVAHKGYIFTGWERRNGAFCGGNLRNCRLSTAGFADSEPLMQLLESDETFYLVPTFERLTWDNGVYR